MDDTPLIITAGLPYSRRIRIKGAASAWPTLSNIVVRSQLRVSENMRSRLKRDLAPFFTPSLDAGDVVLDFRMSSNDTLKLPSGFYSVVISDKSAAADRAMEILRGPLRIRQTAAGR